MTFSQAVWGVFLLATMMATAAVGEDDVDVICRNGALYAMELTPLGPGETGGYQAQTVSLGPAKRVWIALPPNTIIPTEPIAVPDIGVDSVEIPLEYPGGEQRLTRVDVATASGEGLTGVQLIEARIELQSYRLPAGCRILAGREARSYADALLNNAGCLLPATAHERLSRIPDAPKNLARDCGWPADVEAARRSLEKAADRGSMTAGWLLAHLYLGNVAPDVQDLERAYVRMSRTGGIGYQTAELTAGIMKWAGVGTPRDAKAAFTALLPYARRGSKEAQGIIGTMYLNGEGAPRNNVHAYAWCSLAMRADVRHSKPAECVQAAQSRMYTGQLERALDLAVEIHNGRY